MSKILVPAGTADEWSKFLAEPVKHWRTGYSARTLAHSWQDAQGLPVEVGAVLKTREEFSDIELLLAIPEHQVHLPGGARPSQNDIWAIARAHGGLVSIAVEGKVAEPFDRTLTDWLGDRSSGKAARLSYLCGLLGLPSELPGTIRYQLLHRTASALIEAKRFNAAHAVMLVHSFSQTHEWFDDYAAFAELFGVAAAVDQVVTVGDRDGVQLHLAWVRGDARYLER